MRYKPLSIQENPPSTAPPSFAQTQVAGLGYQPLTAPGRLRRQGSTIEKSPLAATGGAGMEKPVLCGPGAKGNKPGQVSPNSPQ